MSWLKKFIGSSVGGKCIVAVSGIALVGFIFGHLTGNLLIFADAGAIDQYAEGLRKFPALLWALRIGILVMVALHIGFTVRLNRANASARPVKYVKKTYRRASLASRSMVLSGLVLLSYILFHLAHFTWRLTDERIGALGPYEVRKMLLITFENPLMTALYVVSVILLGLHLSHGISSLFQTLGLNHNKYNRLIRSLGPSVAGLIVVAYCAIPVSVMLGLVR